MQNGSSDHLHAHHVSLRQLLLSISERMAGVAGAQAEQWPAELEAEAVSRLEELAHELARHFALEEKQAPLEKALRNAPHLGVHAGGLVEQHAGLHAAAAKLAERARDAGASPAAWQQINREFRAFARELVTHERAENEIIWSAWTEDRGGGG